MPTLKLIVKSDTPTDLPNRLREAIANRHLSVALAAAPDMHVQAHAGIDQAFNEFRRKFPEAKTYEHNDPD